MTNTWLKVIIVYFPGNRSRPWTSNYSKIVWLLQFVQARKAVVSNASTWDTVSLLPPDAVPNELQTRAKDTPQCDSFMHLHLGIDAKVLLLYPSTAL
jgi:hypothetical protein